MPVENKISILFNARENTSGGGLKNALNFILNNIENERLDARYIINDNLSKLLKKFNVRINDRFIILPNKNRKFLKQLERDADLVYTMAGPTYLRFKIPHVLGISNPYLSHAKLFNFKHGRNTIAFISTILKTLIQFLFLTKAEFYLFQTEYSRKEFCKKKRIPDIKSAVIPNAWDPNFKKPIKLESSSQIQIYVPGNGFVHKGTDLLPRVANALNNSGFANYIIYTHLSEQAPIWKRFKQELDRYGTHKNFMNMGTVDYDEIEDLYCKADLVLIPSLLETFSVTYLETIQFNKKLIAQDTQFSREICGEYASYSNFFHHEVTANLIVNTVASQHDVQKERQTVMDSAIDQVKRYKLICKTLENYHESLEG